jgi:hypothetical protein
MRVSDFIQHYSTKEAMNVYIVLQIGSRDIEGVFRQMTDAQDMVESFGSLRGEYAIEVRKVIE